MIAGNPGLPSVPDALGWHPPMSLAFRMQLKVERFGFYGSVQGMGAQRLVRSQTQITGEEAHALVERYAKAWPGVLEWQKKATPEIANVFESKNVQAWDTMLSSSDVANALATYRGSATHAVADLLGAPLAEIECKAVEVTANLRAPTVTK